ncbi:hypothetical protein [Micromonospora fluostatini]
MQSLKRDRWIIERQLQRLVVPEGTPIQVGVVGWYQHDDVAAAEWRRRHPGTREDGLAQVSHPRGWGYLASDGHYGLGATTTQRRYDGAGELAAELRALFWACRKLLPRWPTTVLTDYPEIHDLVEAWRRGDTERVPEGYNTEDRESGREAKLLRLARAVHQHRDLVTVKVLDDYADTPLGAGANKLSNLGWRWCANRIRKTEAKESGLATAARYLGVDPVLVPVEGE